MIIAGCVESIIMMLNLLAGHGVVITSATCTAGNNGSKRKNSNLFCINNVITVIITVSQQEFAQHYPQSGWVEHDPEDIWQTTLSSCQQVMQMANASSTEIAAIGITNQRETTLVWDRKTGKPLHRAIVWQDRRTSDLCRSLRDEGNEAMVMAKTGLLLDPYFSATKIAWILDHIDGAREAAERGELAFGTIDSFLLWRLSGGSVHATDATNASRTMLYDIYNHCWSEDLLKLFNIPASILTRVKDSASDFALTRKSLFDGIISISGIAGDQQAATVGQACFKPGMMKSTYGTGCFALLNTGDKGVQSKNRLLTTIAYQLNGKTHYALEGSIFMAGAAVQWLRDGISLIESAEQSGVLAALAPGAGLCRTWSAILGRRLPRGYLRFVTRHRTRGTCLCNP